VDYAPLDDDWQVAIAVVAHPDDLEYGTAAAVARWTAEGRDVRYVMVTRGEAGIHDLPPEQTGPLRSAEQEAAAAVVGVDVVDFLDHRDGLVVADVDLRRDLARSIRLHRPEVVISINYRQTWGGSAWNHADHRAVGQALVDAARDAANPWLFTELADAGLPAWTGLRWIAFQSSPESAHYVGVDLEHVEAARESLRAHRTYLEHLDGGQDDPTQFLLAGAVEAGEKVGLPYAVMFEVVDV
jgi:LmbE family N-acetylglucosaminyl deacetylase